MKVEERLIELAEKATPGPWQIKGEDHGKGSLRIIGANRRTVAYPYGPVPETEANARLIAAAPELLEAAKSAAIDLAANTGPDYPERDSLDRLIAAIAKAEGRE